MKHEIRVTHETGHYFTCNVFDTKEEMNNYYLERCVNWRQEPEPLEFGAMVSPFQWLVHPAVAEKSFEIGEAIFYRGKLGAGLIAHEMLHCALWHERAVMKNENAEFGQDIGEIEERLCYTLTDFVRQFVDKCHELNLFE